MGHRSRHRDEATLGRLAPVDELLPADCTPPGPARTRAGDIIAEVIEQPAWGYARVLANHRAQMNARADAPRHRTIGQPPRRSLRRVPE